MAQTVPTTEPTEVYAGDTLRWTRSLSGFPPHDGWALSYVLTGAHEAPIAIPTTPDGGRYVVHVPASETAEYTPGRYRLIGYASKDGERHQVYRGAVVVHPDEATAAPERSHAERMVRLLEDAMLGVAESGIVEYTVAGRGVKKLTLAEARTELAFWKREAERDGAGPERGPFRRVEVSFAPVE